MPESERPIRRWEDVTPEEPVYGGTGSRWEFNRPGYGWGWFDESGRWHETEHPDAWQIADWE